MEAPQILQTKTKKVVQKIAEVRPTACDNGSSAKGPIIIPARAIDIQTIEISIAKGIQQALGELDILTPYEISLTGLSYSFACGLNASRPASGEPNAAKLTTDKAARMPIFFACGQF